jgi:tRNA pseudouridine38-40 synthase
LNRRAAKRYGGHSRCAEFNRVPRTIKLTLAYDGTDFAGWQSQRGQRTVQDTLEEVLAKITGQFTRVFASGRTDAGVHALAQVVSFETQSTLVEEVLKRALNAELPRDVAALAVEEAPSGFNARRDAKRKRYRYLIHDGYVRDVFKLRYAWHVYKPLDVAAMSRGAQALLGEHDFASFQTSGSERETTVRTVFDLVIERANAPDENVIRLEIEADGFLYNMVRNIVGTLVVVGDGKQPASWIADVLAARNRRSAAPTAPAQGLYLVRVDY